MMVGTLED